MATSGARTRGARWPIATIAALAAGATLTEAARAGGVSERTASRWQHDSAFVDAVREHRREAVGRSRAALVAASGVAVEALVDVARSGPPPARVTAARAILDYADRFQPQPQQAPLTDQERAEWLLEDGVVETLEEGVEAIARVNALFDSRPNRTPRAWERF